MQIKKIPYGDADFGKIIQKKKLYEFMGFTESETNDILQYYHAAGQLNVTGLLHGDYERLV